MNFLAIIPARYASTRFPGKPLARLGGKPVIQRVYEQVAGVLDDAVVATDDERIRDAVRAFGGRVEMTSPDHRSGTDRCWEAYCKQGREYDVVVNVQGDEPFIRPSQLEAVKRCFDDPATDIATLVKPFTEADGLAALENPNSPKVVLDAQSRAIYFSRSVIPYLRGVPREEWLARHTFYKHIGLYAFRADVLRAVTALPQSPLELAESLEQLRWLENGYKIGVGISEVETIGIDTPEDLEKAERFLQFPCLTLPLCQAVYCFWIIFYLLRVFGLLIIVYRLLTVGFHVLSLVVKITQVQRSVLIPALRQIRQKLKPVRFTILRFCAHQEAGCVNNDSPRVPLITGLL